MYQKTWPDVAMGMHSQEVRYIMIKWVIDWYLGWRAMKRFKRKFRCLTPVEKELFIKSLHEFIA